MVRVAAVLMLLLMAFAGCTQKGTSGDQTEKDGSDTEAITAPSTPSDGGAVPPPTDPGDDGSDADNEDVAPSDDDPDGDSDGDPVQPTSPPATTTPPAPPTFEGMTTYFKGDECYHASEKLFAAAMAGDGGVTECSRLTSESQRYVFLGEPSSVTIPQGTTVTGSFHLGATVSATGPGTVIFSIYQGVKWGQPDIKRIASQDFTYSAASAGEMRTNAVSVTLSEPLEAGQDYFFSVLNHNRVLSSTLKFDLEDHETRFTWTPPA